MPMYSSESTSAPKPAFDMDNDAEIQFCRFVEKMPLKPDGMVRLFDRGDYFSAHGADALLVADEVYKTTNVLKYLGRASSSTSKGLPSVTISKNLTKNFLRECLTARQMRVEIYEPEEGQAGRKNNARWLLGKTASPGNISQLEDLLFTDSDMVSDAVSMAIKISMKEGSRIVGCAVVDVQSKIIQVSEFVEDENYGNTESLLIQLGVKECLLPANEKGTDHELVKLRTVIERCQVIVTERKPADFVAKSVDQDLKRLLDESTAGATPPELDLKHAMSALAALLIYLSLLSDLSLHGQFRLRKYDLSQFMRLDASALKALSLMPNPLEGGGGRNMSVYGLLDKCKTSQGKRLLGRWLKQPLVNLHEITKRQNVVEAFVDDSMSRQAIQSDVLNLMPDFHRISKKFHRKAAGLEDIVRIYQAIAKIPKLITLLKGIEPYNPDTKALIDEIYIQPLEEKNDQLAKYQDLVEETIDLESNPHDYVLLPTLDNRLQEFRDEIQATVDEMDKEHRRVGKDLGIEIDKKVHLENHPVYKYSLRITKAEAGLLRGNKDYIELSTQKSGTIFTTRNLKRYSETFEDLTKQYIRESNHLVREIVKIASSYTGVLEELDGVIAAIDVIISFAHVAANASIPYIRPRLSEKGRGDVVLKGARHPCLEEQPDVHFIANDHEMRKDESEFIILTGPNMGGKSTYIRQIGVIALMAQIGSFVPADDAELPVFDCILARVGAGDSQLKGVSTFMAEMLETATILRAATPNSLIIIDELGRGTSTYDGFGLAWAISEHIASKIRCFCLFATHFHELTTLDQSLSHVKNLHVVAHVQPRADGGSDGKVENEITLLYQVKEGICDQSFGIHVAELAEFPESVVKLAKRKAEELEDFGDGASEGVLTKFSKTDSDDGTRLVKSFLDEWKAKVESRGEELTEEQQVEELRKVAQEYRERFEGNPWVQGLLEAF
ncbi:putative DNA mismatch repair protein MSH2 [Papiliotrema laurentii]|uniref:DNA mismatch repair protein MSH2 n=1 Tax=Papiliotrema laurentii TaxID=5418 RepID=A0AAD9FP26_PAPLA|nr:putative DNA mismatch repair protein MSH2 [Papiliotrema laurentii]